MSNKKTGMFDKIKNFFYIAPTKPNVTGNVYGFDTSAGGSKDEERNLGNSIVPIQLSRDFLDVSSWNKAISQAEQLPYPYRIDMQKLYNSAINDGHVFACMQKRKNLNLCEKYVMYNSNGEVDDTWTAYIDKVWFRDYLNYVLDAKFFGYSLISLGDIVDNELHDLALVRRWNVSPDRLIVSYIPEVPSGISFVEGEAADWHVWVKTSSDIGSSGCGYGLLYPVSLCSIITNSNISDNLTYNERFSQPMIILKSSASDTKERNRDEVYLQNMSGGGAAVIRKDDDIELVEAKTGGAYKSYADLEKRQEVRISKILLGHADAIDSIPGKLGNSGEESAAGQSLQEIKEQDGKFLSTYLDILVEKLRNLGVGIPEGMYIGVYNDDEEEEKTEEMNEIATSVSSIAANFAKAGIAIDPSFIEEITGYKVVKAVVDTAVDKNNI